MEKQRNNFELDISIQQLDIEIRFPCQITYSVKIDQQQVWSQETLKLDNYRVNFNGKVTIRGETEWEGKYASKVGVVTVYVVSGNRKNIAGVLDFDAADVLNSQGRVTQLNGKLDKSLDKNSQIVLNVVGRVNGRVSNVNSLTTSLTNSKENSFSSYQTNDTLFNKVGRSITTGTSNDRQSLKKLLNNTVTSPRYEPNRSPSKRNSTNNDRRIAKLQIQKSSYLKQINNLKAEITSLGNQLHSANLRMEEMHGVLQNKDSEIQFLSASLDEKTQQLSNLEGKIYELAGVNQQVERLYFETKQQLQLVSRTQQGSQSELLRVNMELQNRLNIEAQQFRVATEALTQQVFYYRDVVTQEQEGAGNLSSTLKNITEQMVQREAELNTMNQVVGQLRYDNEQKERRVEELEVHLQNVSYTIDNYKLLSKKDTSRLQEYSAQMTNLQVENERLVSLIADIQRGNTTNQTNTFENDIVNSFNQQRQQLINQVNYLSDEIRKANEEIDTLRQNKESVWQTNNTFASKLQEQEDNYQELRLKFKNTEYEVNTLRRQNSLTQSAKDELQRYKDQMIDLATRFCETVLSDQPLPNDTNCPVTAILQQSKARAINFFYNLRADYEALIAQLQANLNNQSNSNIQFDYIAQELSRIQSENSYYNQVVGVKEEQLSKEVAMLKKDVNGLQQTVNTVSFERDDVIERLNQEIISNQQLVGRLGEAEKFIATVDQERNNLAFELERQSYLLSQDFVVSDSSNKNNHIQNLSDQLKVERNRIVQLTEGNRELQEELNKANAVVRTLEFRSLEYRHRLEGLEQEHEDVLGRQNVLNGILKDYQYKAYAAEENSVYRNQEEINKLRQQVQTLTVELEKERAKRNVLNNQIQNISSRQNIEAPGSNIQDVRRQLFNTQIRYEAQINELLQDNIAQQRGLNNLKANLINDKQQFIKSKQQELIDLRNKIKLTEIAADERIRINNQAKNDEICSLKYQLLIFREEHRKVSTTSPELNLKSKEQFVKQVSTLQSKIDDISELVRSIEACIPFLIHKFKDMHNTFQNFVIERQFENNAKNNNDYGIYGNRSGERKTVIEIDHKFQKIEEISNYLTVSVQKILSLNSDVEKLTSNKAVSGFKFKELHKMVEGRQYEQLRRAIQDIVVS